MSWEVILGMAGSHDRVTSTLPIDATVTHIVLLDQSRQARVYFTSEMLDPIPEGGAIPLFEVALTSHREVVAS